ncbi:MAG: hypothetical protein ACUVQG_11820 [Thermogutta sp.]
MLLRHTVYRLGEIRWFVPEFKKFESGIGLRQKRPLTIGDVRYDTAPPACAE